MRCYAEDLFLIGRELMWQDCDWLTENLVSTPAKLPKLCRFPLSLESCRGLRISGKKAALLFLEREKSGFWTRRYRTSGGIIVNSSFLLAESRGSLVGTPETEM